MTAPSSATPDLPERDREGDETGPDRGTILATRVLLWLRNGMAGGLVLFLLLDLAGIGRPDADRPEEVSPDRPIAVPAPLPRPEPGDRTRPYDPGMLPQGPQQDPIVLPDGTPLAQPRAARMTFTLRGEAAPFVVANGAIAQGTAEELRRYLDDEGRTAVRVVLNSGGGSVSDALEMGRLVRDAGLETQVPPNGLCASACPLVLAGGVERIGADSAWIGLHQPAFAPGSPLPASADRAILDIQSLNAVIMDRLRDWGVDPAIWITAMETPPEKITFLTPEDLTDSALVTRMEPASGS